MDDRTLTPDDLEKLLFHADRIGLVSYVSGMTPGWMPAMRGITYTEAIEAFAHFRDNGPPAPRSSSARTMFGSGSCRSGPRSRTTSNAGTIRASTRTNAGTARSRSKRHPRARRSLKT